MLWKRIHSQFQGRARRNDSFLLLRRGKVAQVQGASFEYAKFMFSKRFVDQQAVGLLNLKLPGLSRGS
jgi:hypothetical protein